MSSLTVAPPPRVSIITICYNDINGLRSTIDSVRGQDREGVEFIIVDGGSSDGTADLLSGVEGVDRWVSERDRGIYDAMNKGVRMATGEWVCFMNSGDCFVDRSVLATLAPALDATDADLVYGRARFCYPDGDSRTLFAGPPERLVYGMICSHQALFARRSVLERFPFAMSGTAADYRFFVEAWQAGCKFQRVETMVAAVTAGGVSDTKRLASVRQRWEILGSHGLRTPGLTFYYAYQALRAVVVPPLKRLLPHWVIRRGRKDRH